jgi:excisionase family DNA binding protein
MVGARIGRSVLIEQAGEMLGVSRRTVYYWIRAGRLSTVRTPGGSQRVLLTAISAQIHRELAELHAEAADSSRGMAARGGQTVSRRRRPSRR